MCVRCDSISEKIEIKYPYQLYDLVKQLKDILVEDTLVLLEGNCNLDDIQEKKPWPDDVISLCFQCTHCNRTFSLEVETYHGSGGYWDFSD